MSGERLVAELHALRAHGGPLAALEVQDLSSFAADLEEVRCATDELLIRAGDAADAVFVVLEGLLEATTPAAAGERRVLAQIGPGELVGEVALVIGGERTADVRAVGPARLARLARARFDELLGESPEVWRRVIELVRARMRRGALLPHLHRLFGPFEPAEGGLLRELAESVEQVVLRRGATLYAAGDEADAAYVVLSGQLAVAPAADAAAGADLETTRPHEAGRGGLLGETGLLTGAARAETAYALRDAELARIPRERFLALAEQRPQMALRLACQVITRLTRGSATETRATGPLACFALLPSRREVPLEPLASGLAEELRRHGSLAYLSSETVDAALGRPGIAQASEADPAALRLTGWLHEQEERHRFVVYRADRAWTPWTARCAGLADQIVVVADGAASPELGDIESRLPLPAAGVRGPRRTLVLVHPPELALPAGTARWLALREVDEVYHLRRDQARDLARVARLLGGRAVGVVLGGGGARGFAHLGVLRAFEELGVPVDLIGGASIGAPVAFPTARGLDAASGLALVRKEFSSLLDYTLPLASLISGKRISGAIEQNMSGVDIEDLWLPFFCVSTNLTTAESKVHVRGELGRAVRASVSIPGVLPPVPMGDDLLVDGGLLNNLPIDVMRRRNPHGTVIAIDVAPPRGPSARFDFGFAVSGWGLALDRIRPWRKGRSVPALAATILQSQIVAANRSRQRMLDAGLADFYRNIHVRGIGMLDFDKVEKVARLGYEDAIGPLREWVEGGGLERH